MTVPTAAETIRAQCDAASARYARVQQLRAIVELVGKHSSELNDSMFGEFFAWAANWYRNELLLEIAKAFDKGDADTLSVRRGLRFLRDHADDIDPNDVAPKMIEAWASRNSVVFGEGDDLPTRVRSCATALTHAIRGHSVALGGIRTIRNKVLAHHDRRGAPANVRLAWADITRAHELILQFIDLCACLIEGGGYGVTSGGEYSVGNSDYPQRALSNLFELLFRTRAGALPERYMITANGPRASNPGVWEVLGPSGESVHLAHDPETAALTAWVHSTGADVSRRNRHPGVFSLDFQRDEFTDDD